MPCSCFLAFLPVATSTHLVSSRSRSPVTPAAALQQLNSTSFLPSRRPASSSYLPYRPTTRSSLLQVAMSTTSESSPSSSTSTSASASRPLSPPPGQYVADADVDLHSTAPKKVAILVEPSPFTHVSGYSNRYKTYLKHLNEAGDEVLLVTPDNKPLLAPKSFEGAKITNIRGFRFPFYPQITLSTGFFSGTWSALKKFNPDIIHVSSPGFMLASGIVYARLLRKPLLLSYHTHIPNYTAAYKVGFLTPLVWALLRLVHNRADLTITTSVPLCQELRQNGIQRVALWRKGIDTEIFDPVFKSQTMRNRLTNGHPERVLLTYVGRLGAEKNIGQIRDMLDRLLQQGYDVHLSLVGAGPFRPNLEKHYASLAERVTFMGMMTGRELSEAFASADIFIMPSESETLGFVVLESMASGVPVVAARAGGIPDLIAHKVDSYMYPPGDVNVAVQYIKELIDNPELRQQVAHKAREEALRWSWSSATAVTRNLHFTRATYNFKYRAMGGYGLPRSLSLLRYFRIRWAQFRAFLRNLILGKKQQLTS